MADEFPSNSNKLKEASLVRDRPRIETRPVTEQTAAVEESVVPAQQRPSGFVRARKVPLVREIFVALFPEGWAGLKNHLVWDKLVPWLRESLHAGWDDMGDVIFQGTSSRPRQGSHVSYDRQYRTNQSSNRRTMVDSISRDYQEIIWDTEDEARQLLRVLRAILREHRVVLLSDYNQEVGNATRPEQNYYGWINLDHARIERVYGPEGGYVVVLPRPVEIDIHRSTR